MLTSRARVVLGSIAFLAVGHSVVRTNRAHALGPRDRHLTSIRHGISVEAPAGWTLSQHTGYGDTVVLLLHPDGSRISLTAALTTAPDAAQLIEQNRKGLLAQKLTPGPAQPGPRGFVGIDILAPDRAERLRQLYFVRPIAGGRQAIILTLVGRASAFSDHVAALDFVAGRLSLDEPTPTGQATKSQPPIVPKLALPDLGGTPSDGAGAGAGAGGGSAKGDQSRTAVDTTSAGVGGAPAAGGGGGSGGQLRLHPRKRNAGMQQLEQR